MTIQWFVPPASGGVVGPGLRVHVQSDLPVPEPDTHWTFRVSKDADNTLVECTQAVNVSDNEIDSLVHPTTDTHWFLARPKGLVNDQDDAFLRAIWSRADNTVIDSSTIPVTWDTRTPVPWLTQQAAAEGGFTATDRAQLDTSVQLAAFGIGGGLGDLVEGALEQLGKRLFGLELIEPDLSGEGVLTRPGGPYGVNAFGIAWQIISWPPGLGFDEGAPDQTEISYGQLSTMRELSETTGFYPTSSWYMDGAVGSREWAFSAPDQVAYYVLPGVTVRAWWIVLFGPSESP